MFYQKLKKWAIGLVFILFIVCFTFAIAGTVTASAEGYETPTTEQDGEVDASTSGVVPLSSGGDQYVNLGGSRLAEGEKGLTNLHYIENANYFLANPLHHINDKSDNSNGTCTTVAMQILVGYHNYYSDRRLLPQNGSNGKELLASDYGNLNEHPTIKFDASSANRNLGRSSIGTADGVYDRIFEETFWAENPYGGQNLFSVVNGTKKFLEKDSQLTSWATNFSTYNQNSVISELSSGRPVVVGFNPVGGHSSHVVVAYGYAIYAGELCYITHYGWTSSYVQMLVPESWLSYQVIMSVNHAHRFTDTGVTYQNTYRALQCTTCGYTTLDDKYLTKLFAGGTGTIADPFLISTEAHFRNINQAHRTVYAGRDGYQEQINYAFKLKNSVVLSGDWTPFTYKFSGDFSGNGYYITYTMNITQNDLNATINQGLFGFVVGDGKIHDLELLNCSIRSDGNISALNSYDIPSIGIVAGSFFESKGMKNITVTNAVIDCNISNAAIGALCGSYYSNAAENCIVREVNATSSITNNTHGYLGGMAGLSDSIALFRGCSVKITLTNTAFNEDNDMMGEVIGNSSVTPSDYQITANVTMNKGGCVAAGTLITLADGRQVPVESLTGNEQLLVWNLYTGTYDTAPILFIDRDSEQTNKVINLAFSDGTSVKVIYEHGFWDYDLNQYVYLDKNAAQYIGHWFNKHSADEAGNMTSVRVQLTDVTISEEVTVAYSPVTYGHLCYYVNGMLSMPGGIEGLFNTFEVDAETMRYDEAKMAEDIAEYGLFTYEEFAALVPVSQEAFAAFNGQYLKVALGKGLVSAERLQSLVIRYAEYLN